MTFGEREAREAGQPGNGTAGASFADPLDRITINPLVCHGKPIIRGMRIRVKDVLEMLASGMSAEEILDDFPYLEREDINACLLFAAHQSDYRVVPVTV